MFRRVELVDSFVGSLVEIQNEYHFHLNIPLLDEHNGFSPDQDILFTMRVFYKWHQTGFNTFIQVSSLCCCSEKNGLEMPFSDTAIHTMILGSNFLVHLNFTSGGAALGSDV